MITTETRSSRRRGREKVVMGRRISHHLHHTNTLRLLSQHVFLRVLRVSVVHIQAE